MRSTGELLVRSLGFKLGVVLILVAVVAFAFAAFRGAEARAMARDGVWVQGEVLEKWTGQVRRTTGGVSGYETVWNLRYRFQPASGQPVEDEGAVSRAVWEGLEPGGPVSVRYLPDAPSRHEIAGNEIGSDAFALFAGGSVSAAAGLALLVGAALAAAQTARILAHGIEHAAVVVAIDRQGAGRGVPDRWRARYSYTDATGTAHTGTTGVARPGTPPPEIGARIPVRVDPARPQRSRWIGEL